MGRAGRFGLTYILLILCIKLMGFPGGSVVKNPPANADVCQFDPWVGKICSEGHDEPLQDSCLENLMDRGA